MKVVSKLDTPSATEPTKQAEENASPVIRCAKFRYEQFKPNSLIENLSYMLIRPPKLLYNPKDLEVIGQANLTHNHFEHKIGFELSLYLPKKVPPKYVVLYLHCNSSNRMEGQSMVKYLPHDVGLACFDFNGCGNRKGQWVTLGVEESKEVDIAARWLKEQHYTVVGWGRSMGSVSLLMSKECSIMVADSPFCDLTRLCKESGQYIPYLPFCIFSCLFPCVFCCVRKDIESKTQQDIMNRLDIEQVMADTDPNKAIIFLSGDNDTMIDKRHSEALYQKFQGRKQLLIFEGNHNSTRSQSTVNKVFKFIDETISLANDGGSSWAEKQKTNQQKSTITPMQITEVNLATRPPEPSSPSNVTLSVEPKRKAHCRN